MDVDFLEISAFSLWRITGWISGAKIQEESRRFPGEIMEGFHGDSLKASWKICWRGPLGNSGVKPQQLSKGIFRIVSETVLEKNLQKLQFSREIYGEHAWGVSERISGWIFW